MATDLKGQVLLDAYREALRLLYGAEIATKSELWFDRGWYYITIAQRYPDGSIGTINWAGRASYILRAKELAQRLEVLRKRIEQKESTSCE